MKTAVIGLLFDSSRTALSILYNLFLPCTEFTFLVTYRGPGCGSMPSSVRSRIQVLSCMGQLKIESGARSRVGWDRRLRVGVESLKMSGLNGE